MLVIDVVGVAHQTGNSKIFLKNDTESIEHSAYVLLTLKPQGSMNRYHVSGAS